MNGERRTNETGFTAVVDIYQVGIQIQMLICTHLNSGISSFLSDGAWRECHFSVQSVGREVDF